MKWKLRLWVKSRGLILRVTWSESRSICVVLTNQGRVFKFCQSQWTRFFYKITTLTAAFGLNNCHHCLQSKKCNSKNILSRFSNNTCVKNNLPLQNGFEPPYDLAYSTVKNLIDGTLLTFSYYNMPCSLLRWNWLWSLKKIDPQNDVHRPHREVKV